MTQFYEKRREPLLNEAPCLKQRQLATHRIARDSDLLKTELSVDGARTDGWSAWNSSISRQKWCLMMLDYSQGESINQLANSLPGMVEALERSVLPHPTYETDIYYLSERNSYSWFLSLLTFAKLLHQDEYLLRIAAILNVAYDDNRGQDQLYETLFQKLGLHSVPTHNSFDGFKCYPILLEAIEATPEKRPKLMQSFLKKWYPSMRGIIWHNTHVKNPNAFTGYWCWEAALVTYLWDIDDTSYRGMPFYPKDLVDWARQKTTISDIPASTQAGSPCPQSGWWFTPAKADSRAFFNQGEVMPDFPGNDYGTVFWQWDADQRNPTL